MTAVKQRRWLVTAILVAAVATAVISIRGAGRFLFVEDPLSKSEAIVVIGGRVPFRAMKGAALYKEGLAPQVWLTQPILSAAEVEMARLGVHPTLEYVYSQAVLERLGVPARVIHVLPGRNNNTATEMRTIASYARAHGVSRVILVTSNYHSRRVRTLWHRLVGSSPEAIVRFTSEEPFDADRWWADAADGWAVSREWFGLLNAWLGFPIRSEHW